MEALPRLTLVAVGIVWRRAEVIRLRVVSVLRLPQDVVVPVSVLNSPQLLLWFRPCLRDLGRNDGVRIELVHRLFDRRDLLLLNLLSSRLALAHGVEFGL